MIRGERILMNRLLNRINTKETYFSFVFILLYMAYYFEMYTKNSVWKNLLLTILVYVIINISLRLIKFCWNHIKKFLKLRDREENKIIRLVSFMIIWSTCFIVFLNMYPGTLSCDTPGQMAEALGINKFENLNPFINTLMITIFVRIGVFIKDVNLGVALYTLFQLTLYSVVTSKVLYLLYKKGFHIVILVATMVFYAINPINLIYATGMWKDTFFAFLLLYTSTIIYEEVDNPDSSKKGLKNKIKLGLAVFVTSLSRNSAWSAFLIFGIFAALGKKQTLKKTGVTVIVGALLSIMVMLFIYPMFGVVSTNSYLANSLQLQQIARVAKDEVLTDAEREEIEFFLREEKSIDDLAVNYSSSLVDPLRGQFDSDKVGNEEGKLSQLSINLFLNHTQASINSIIDHTKTYWWPRTSGWIWDTRIFENDFGIERHQLVFEGHEIAAFLYTFFAHIPLYKWFNYMGVITWILLLAIFLKGMDYTGCSLYIVPLTIIIGLILFSYASLFRYIYAVFLMKPLFIAYQYVDN